VVVNVTEKRILIEHSTPYGRGQTIDMYRSRDHEDAPVVLLWHGRGPNESEVLRPLASAMAFEGLVVGVPDWQSDPPGIGKQQLLASIDFTLDRAPRLGGNPDQVVIAGWSLGATAAADLLLHPDAVPRWRPKGFVGIAGDYDESPISGLPLLDVPTRESQVPCLLIHGTQDPVVPVDRSRQFAGFLESTGWQVAFEELPTDHAGVIGTEYDPYTRRCYPTREPYAESAKLLVARRITELTTRI
jgi:predicted esterase